MSVRRLLAAAVVTLSAGLVSASPAAAHSSGRPVAADAYAFGIGRLGASTGALIGLAGVVVAWLALSRPAGRLGTATGTLGAATAVTAGVVATVLGVVVAATADGGLGTGNGLGGAYVAMLVGVAATVLGGLALRRCRRAG
ncbi:DUF6223 family protein [Streptomyces sp. NPDC087512]|uniref:DUF6223 family protein n=1 Tax=Streptomyces sp. NPDC087512 TaxID=3155059 RepID=UPI003421BD3B